MAKTEKLSVMQGVAMLVSALLGSGVFIIPAIASQVSGSWSLLAWAIMGVLIAPIVFTFAQLGKFYPHAGGTAYYVQQAFGERSGRLVSWLFIWVVALGTPVITITAANFLQNALVEMHLLSDAVDYRLMIAIGILCLVFVINLLGLKTAAIIQSVLSVLIVSTLLFASLDVQLQQNLPLPTAEFSVSKVALTATFILWCFLGIEAITHIADDFRHPERDFPLTIFIGITIALVVYALISISLLKMGFYGDQEKNLNSVVHLVEASLGSKGYLLVNLVGFCTCFISISLYFVGFSRLLQSMAIQQQIHSSFQRINSHKVAYWGLSFAVALCLSMLLVADSMQLAVDNLIAYANGLFILIYLAAGIAGVKLLTGKARYLAMIASVTCLILFIALGKEMLFALCLVAALSVYYTVIYSSDNRINAS
ncbi:L-methionine/branched-chain amino acid transporter [Psychromonas sp. 14N.309.X.WAT.B.A12]|uniref:L-methionine/branched-chain amino acid transporter n=1 Tax=unclassified Psychromonas TaxID=2614957 RepID=UPI0025B1F303|nr:L-methionine/branched-chain amino acid transporter [Psychromonas sp. 14N.309.X.WAT.B.A12]MDN2664556.1 L-methionine/branched-chain amino acid transporter [Psychromonas sp. 14N.309.X.WAT.B.A12]